ncbi:MAG: hypothetical protein HQ402_00170 [Parcubacteria group bacterium]|nr:hypothetical protein [Parcubacteria group bacterium]
MGMIYFLYGTDENKAREKLHELTNSLLKKKPNAELFKIDSEHWDPAQLEEFIGGQGLFADKYIVIVDKVFESLDIREIISDKLKELKESNNIFVFLEGEVDKVTLGKIEKNAEKVQKFEKKETFAKKKFNIFSLTGAFGDRDKKNLWILYQKALQSGVEPEEVHGILFWQLRSMISAQSSKNAESAGLKPFVYQKSIGYGKNFTKQELENLSTSFISIYHDARRGIKDFDIALEKFLLSV